jgi:predicted amino acid dehydrogenase
LDLNLMIRLPELNQVTEVSLVPGFHFTAWVLLENLQQLCREFEYHLSSAAVAIWGLDTSYSFVLARVLAWAVRHLFLVSSPSPRLLPLVETIMQETGLAAQVVPNLEAIPEQVNIIIICRPVGRVASLKSFGPPRVWYDLTMEKQPADEVASFPPGSRIISPPNAVITLAPGCSLGEEVGNRVPPWLAETLLWALTDRIWPTFNLENYLEMVSLARLLGFAVASEPQVSQAHSKEVS